MIYHKAKQNRIPMKKSSFLIHILAAALLYVGWQFFDNQEEKSFDMAEVNKVDSGLMVKINIYEDSIANLITENIKMRNQISRTDSIIENIKIQHEQHIDTIRIESDEEAVERFLSSTLPNDEASHYIDPIKAVNIPVKSVRIANELILERDQFKQITRRQKEKITQLKEINANLAHISTRKDKIIETIEQRNHHLKSNLEAQEKHYKEKLRKQKIKNRIKLGVVSGLAALLVIFG